MRNRSLVNGWKVKKPIIIAVFFILIGGGLVHSDPEYTHTVLGLYNSEHNQTEKENEINFYVANILRGIGLEVRFHDITEGIPENTDEYRAVISWFRGGTMKEPEAYLRFMRDVIRSGKKFIVFGTLGAFGDSDTGTYIDKGMINTAFSLLGLRYEYGWTDNAELLEIETIDSTMVEAGGKQDVDTSRFYYRFVPSDRALNIHLSLSRKDNDDEASPVIVTNENGGFALGSYVYHYKDGKVTILLDIEAFLTEALFPSAPREKIALLVDSTSERNRTILSNAEIVLTRAKIDYEVIEKQDFSGMLPEDLFTFTMAGLILSDDAGLGPAFFHPFLEKGGGIVSLASGRFSSLSPLLGLTGNRTAAGIVTGYEFSSDFILGEGLSLEDPHYTWLPGPVAPKGKVRVLASGGKGDVPLLWSHQQNGGPVLVWNWDAFTAKMFRGLLLESFLSLRPVGIAGTPGIGAMFIDDWPLPMYNVVKDPLSITDTEFYTTVWWPDIKRLFDTFDIPFSTYLIFEYNSTNEPPYIIEEFFIAKGKPPTTIAREIIASENELAFHGYNHRSLLLDDGYPHLGYWPNPEAMKEALETAKEEWKRLFGDHTLPLTYVAPNNAISKEGIRAVYDVFPTIHVIGTVISGQAGETSSEFTIGPATPRLYYLPRLSSGYILDPPLKASIVSGIMGYGIWTHFIHADDIFDPNRSRGLDWPELKDGLEEAIEFIQTHYPWLEYVTVNKAGNMLREYDNRKAEYAWDPDRRTLTVTSTPGFRFRVRANGDHSFTRADGAKVLHQYGRYGDGQSVVLELTRGQAEIFFSR